MLRSCAFQKSQTRGFSEFDILSPKTRTISEDLENILLLYRNWSEVVALGRTSADLSGPDKSKEWDRPPGAGPRRNFARMHKTVIARWVHSLNYEVAPPS